MGEIIFMDEDDFTKPEILNITKTFQTDLILYSGSINSDGTREIFKLTKNPSSENIILILCTYGGDPAQAFKIARRLQESYRKFSLLVYGPCKSAGTLIAVGADEIIMSESAELGPLDIQIPNKNEIGTYNSGLDINEALNALRDETITIFGRTFNQLINHGLSTQLSAEVAVKLASNFVAPILSQINPIKLGEISRAMEVGRAYSTRLTAQKRGNLKSTDFLYELVEDYPDHGFVIDFLEAQRIFKNIRHYNNEEISLGEVLDSYVWEPSEDQPIVIRLPREVKDETKK